MPLENKWLFSFWSAGRDKCLTWNGGLVYIGVGMQLFHTRTISSSPLSIHSSFSFFFFPFIIIFFFLLYNIVLVFPYINMNPPQVYTCSPSWTPLPPPSPYHPSISSFILPSLSQIGTSRVPVSDSGSCFDSGNPPPEAKATSTSLHHPGLFHALSDFWRLTKASYIAFCQLSSLLWDQNIVIPFPDFHWDLWGKKINLWPQYTSLNGRQGHSHMFYFNH